MLHVASGADLLHQNILFKLDTLDEPTQGTSVWRAQPHMIIIWAKQ